jgi:hypothetical protein
MLRFAILTALASGALAACPNSCSGHGTCGNDDICTCFQDWITGDHGDGGDCSQRRCPFDHSWADAPTASNTAHALTECSSKGICDRKTGECECFDGYWGKACRRAACPNDCSGHGTCEYMKELRSDVGDFFKWTGQAPTSDQFYHAFNGLWDFDRQMACLCDAKWTDVDCSRRMCPKGNYALYSDATTTDEIHKLKVTGAVGTVNTYYALIFRSTLGEEFTTRPLHFNAGTTAGGTSAAQVQNALHALPNKVVEDVVVTNTGGGYGGTGDTWTMSVTFAGAANTGDQYQLGVINHVCTTGCMPYLAASTDEYDGDTGHMVISTIANANKEVNTECSGRGICDYESGICECFSGYTDESCSTQTALI